MDVTDVMSQLMMPPSTGLHVRRETATGTLPAQVMPAHVLVIAPLHGLPAHDASGVPDSDVAAPVSARAHAMSEPDVACIVGGGGLAGGGGDARVAPYSPYLLIR